MVCVSLGGDLFGPACIHHPQRRRKEGPFYTGTPIDFRGEKQDRVKHKKTVQFVKLMVAKIKATKEWFKRLVYKMT